TSGLIQAVVIVSDGQFNQGGSDAVRDLMARVADPKRPIPVFTVGVGAEWRQPVAIRIDELQAPGVARPDDQFPVRVPVVGEGLPGQEFTVELFATRVKDKNGKAVAGEKELPVDKLPGKFSTKGELPRGEVEFTVDLAKVTGKKADDES